MTDGAKRITQTWAREFNERYGKVADSRHLHDLIERERKDGTTFRRCLTRLPFDLFATAVVHYTSQQIAREKVREVSFIAGEEITRREYWNKLDRAHHFVEGVVAVQAELHEGDRAHRAAEFVGVELQQ